jgi:hypothetical protein
MTRPAALFFHLLSDTYVTECVELNPRFQRWFIKVGFAGFNTPTNNGRGYASKSAAEGVVLKYQRQGGL